MKKPKPHGSRRKVRRVENREPAFKRGYDHWWRVQSGVWLLRFPECAVCGLVDVRSRMVVDHKIPHRGDMVFFRDQSNWQTLCRKCHGIKTGRGE